MIFEPYLDEHDIINQVHQYNENEYILIRLTKTMIVKNNIDANGLFRDLLKSEDIVDYNHLDNGSKNGTKHTAKLLLNDSIQNITMNFYKVNNKRSDPRFSIYGIRKMYNDKKVSIGDLLYITVVKDTISAQIVILNTTNNTPEKYRLRDVFGLGAINESALRLIPEIMDIAKSGFHPNSKGKGKVSPKDVGV